MRRSVEAIFLVYEDHHPHVLMFQTNASCFRLPGGVLKPGQDEIEGLKNCLNERLGPSNPETQTSEENINWNVGECLSIWWRPNFANYCYPYLAPHVSRPKEQKKMFLVHLPDKQELFVPSNLKLVAVPLLELYYNASRYGPEMSNIPQYLSRFTFYYAD
ncbi:Cleavage/polyadenylation specificity factor subunit 5 [Dimargaris cristalligena]|uniref:Cleavage/polyadenylation specificity factor subunit 5 n=1 Tax=Dimargaris cristalligena TaxID=215637 RepID=A0A4V1J583_9FUNG|nr:Cleavage/polyadenylation specificity factor subunit 5 [Dimargaris cristalligena]|eukprot:RKP38159.1 Cleavage/polyadenylation specificity factor subunit 5 [Dimargaris cristalligena]